MIYKDLTVSDLGDFFERFNRCFDGVIEGVSINYSEGVKNPIVNIIIQTQDEEAEDGWSSLVLCLHEVINLRFEEGKASYRVLSDGLVAKNLDEGLWGVGFDEEQEEEESIDGFMGYPVGFVSSKITWAVK